jgi:hypothetical protein
MPIPTALEVKRVPHSEELLHPGEFVFIPKREPIRTFQSTPIAPPSGLFRRLWWDLFGKKHEIKQIVELLWPEIDTVIMNCPKCNGPLATTRNHVIVRVEPLTIETPLTCPYCRTNTFKVAEGKIMPA